MYVPPLGSCELGGFNELITSRFGRHLKNRMLRFPAQILPMMGFSSCNNSDIFQWPKLVSMGGSCSEPFSCLQHVAASPEPTLCLTHVHSVNTLSIIWKATHTKNTNIYLLNLTSNHST